MKNDFRENKNIESTEAHSVSWLKFVTNNQTSSLQQQLAGFELGMAIPWKVSFLKECRFLKLGRTY
jgi:hypothetical protein